MKCIAQKTCQIRNSKGRAVLYTRGMVGDFDECPDSFVPVEDVVVPGGGVNFEELSEEAINVADFHLDELKAHMDEEYPTVRYAPNIGRDKLIEKYIYARDAVTEAKQVVSAASKEAPSDDGLDGLLD